MPMLRQGVCQEVRHFLRLFAMILKFLSSIVIFELLYVSWKATPNNEGFQIISKIVSKFCGMVIRQISWTWNAFGTNSCCC